MNKIIYIFFILILISCTSEQDQSSDETIKLSNNPQLFLDDYIISNMDGISRELQQPEKHSSNPLISQDYPWEDRAIEIYGTVLYDYEINKFRCWYRATSDTIPTPEYNICYAESNDGINWTKPNVGSGEIGIYAGHNVVIRDMHGICVLEPTSFINPDRKHIAAGGNKIAFSSNGFEWIEKNWISIGINDTSTSVVLWENNYLAYVRNQGSWVNGVMRQVAISSSTDFDIWKSKETILQTDAIDGYPWTQPYGLSVTAYGDQLIGILWLLHLDQIAGNNKLGDMDTQLVVSRDGYHWFRVCDRAVFLEPTINSWDQGRVYPGTTMFIKDDIIYIYYTGTSMRHGSGSFGECGIGLATLPVDRFVAVKQQDSTNDGILTTKLFNFFGNQLYLNAEAVSATDIQVEVIDSNGSPINGFNSNKSRLITYDFLRHRVIWEQDNGAEWSFGKVENDYVALRFTIKYSSQLYAFQIIK